MAKATTKKETTKKTVAKKVAKKKVAKKPTSGNNPRLQKIAEKLWQKDLLGCSQVLGCWMHLASPYEETKWGAYVSVIEVCYLNDGKFFLQYFGTYYEDGMEAGKEHQGHRMINTIKELEEVVTRYFEMRAK